MGERYQQQAHVLQQQPVPPRAGFRAPTSSSAAANVYQQQPVISQPSPIRGAAFGQMDIQPPLRTRSTPPSADTFQQPRFTPHKSTGPTLVPTAPVYNGVPHSGKHGFAPMYALPDMYAGYAIGHHGYMHNTYLQQQQAQRMPIHQPVKRASKALQIVDPATGKPIVMDGLSTPKADPVQIVVPKATRPNWAQSSPINSALVLSCSNNNNVAYSKPPMTPIHSPPSRPSAVSQSPMSSDVLNISSKKNMAEEQKAKDASKSLKKIDIPKESVQLQNATAPIDSSSVKASSKHQPANHLPAGLNVKKDVSSPATSPSFGSSHPQRGPSPERSPKTIKENKAAELSAKPSASAESPSEKSKHPSIVVSSPSQLGCPDISSCKSAKSAVSPSSKGSSPVPLDNIPEIVLDSKNAPILPKPVFTSPKQVSTITSSPTVIPTSPKFDASQQIFPNLSSKKNASHPPDSSISTEGPTASKVPDSVRRYTVEEIFSLENDFGGLPEGIALDSPCLKQNPNSASGRSGFTGYRGSESTRRMPRANSGMFRNSSSGDFQHDSGNRRLPSDADRHSDRQKHDRHHPSRRSSHRGGVKEISRHEGPAVEPLKKSETRWIPRQKVSNDEETLKRKIKAVLNKLTLDKFQTLSKQFLALVQEKVSSVDHLKTVVELIFDKALSEPTFVKMYSSLCVAIAESMPEFQSGDDKGASNEDRRAQTFKRLLLNQCQQEFERGTSFDVDSNLDEEEREESVRQQKRRFLGNVRFIGELFKDSMLAERIMHTCIYHFLQEAIQPMEEDIEALCKLLATIGKKFDRHQAKNHIDSYFNRMQMMSTNPSLSRRARFMLLDAIDLRKSGWKPRRKEVEAKTIDEFRQEMEREAAEQNARSSRTASRFDTFIGRGSTSKPVSKPSKPVNEKRSFQIRAPSDSRRTQSFDRRIPSSSRLSSVTAAEGSNQSQTVPRPASSRVQTAPSASKQASAEQIKSYSSEMDLTIKDFLKNPGDIEEIRDTLASMADWEKSARNKTFISKALSISMEQKDSDRDTVVDLLTQLHLDRIITSSDLSAGFNDILEFLNDLLFDIPRSPDYLGTIFGRLLSNGVLSIDCLNESVFDDQIEVGVFGEFVARVLTVVAAEKGESETKEMIRNANHFDFSIFLRKPFGCAPAEFVRKRHLDSILPEELLRDDLLPFLEENKLDEADELIRDILIDRDNHRGAAVICRCLLDHCLLSTSYPKASYNTAQVEPSSKEAIQKEQSLLKQFSSLFKRISGSMQYPESILEEIHKLCYMLGFPDGLSLRLFKVFADMGIIPSASYSLWRKQAPEYFKKSRTLESVSGFIDRIVNQHP